MATRGEAESFAGDGISKRVSSATGSKIRQRDDEENRALTYSKWRYDISTTPAGAKLYCIDVDFIEWGFDSNVLYPAAVMEVTRCDMGKHIGEQYLESILNRFNSRDLQGRAARYVAKALSAQSGREICAFINLFREDASEFWVYNLTREKGWWHATPEEYTRFLRGLRGWK